MQTFCNPMKFFCSLSYIKKLKTYFFPLQLFYDGGHLEFLPGNDLGDQCKIGEVDFCIFWTISDQKIKKYQLRQSSRAKYICVYTNSRQWCELQSQMNSTAIRFIAEYFLKYTVNMPHGLYLRFVFSKMVCSQVPLIILLSSPRSATVKCVASQMFTWCFDTFISLADETVEFQRSIFIYS